jgi:uncharacterized membrane protein
VGALETTTAEQRKEFRLALAEQRKDFQTTVAQQQEEIKILTASLKAQAAQIQRVSARLEVSKLAPRVVINDQ